MGDGQATVVYYAQLEVAQPQPAAVAGAADCRDVAVDVFAPGADCGVAAEAPAEVGAAFQCGALCGSKD